MADENITLTISRAGRWLCEERHELSTPYDLSLIPRAHVKKPMCWSVHICNPTIHVERKEGREKKCQKHAGMLARTMRCRIGNKEQPCFSREESKS